MLFAGFTSLRSPGTVNAFDWPQHLLRTVCQKITQCILSKGFGFRKGKEAEVLLKHWKVPSVTRKFHWNKARVYFVGHVMDKSIEYFYSVHQVFNLVGYVIMQNLWMLYLKTNKPRYLIRSSVLSTHPMRRKVTGRRNGLREELRGPEDK